MAGVPTEHGQETGSSNPVSPKVKDGSDPKGWRQPFGSGQGVTSYSIAVYKHLLENQGAAAWVCGWLLVWLSVLGWG